MAAQTVTTEIVIDPMTASYMQEHNQGNPLTDAAAQQIADTFNRLIVERVQDAYPDAMVILQPLNGIDAVRAYNDNGDDDEIVASVGLMMEALWEQGDQWDTVQTCAYCSSNVCHAENEYVPLVDADEDWQALAQDHSEDCEWIVTRAHRVAY